MVAGSTEGTTAAFPAVGCAAREYVTVAAERLERLSAFVRVKGVVSSATRPKLALVGSTRDSTVAAATRSMSPEPRDIRRSPPIFPESSGRYAVSANAVSTWPDFL